MFINIKESMRDFLKTNYPGNYETMLSYLPAEKIDNKKIAAVFVNEVVASSPDQDFYGTAANPEYFQTTRLLFQKAGVNIESIQDVLSLGLYITNAVKLPKTSSSIEIGAIQDHLPILEKELSLFPQLKAIMLMGDVAKKSFNLLAKKNTGKNAVPAIATYKLRGTELYYGTIRIYPSYIMTGKNLLIEKSKVDMASQDIAHMLHYISNGK